MKNVDHPVHFFIIHSQLFIVGHSIRIQSHITDTLCLTAAFPLSSHADSRLQKMIQRGICKPEKFFRRSIDVADCAPFPARVQANLPRRQQHTVSETDSVKIMRCIYYSDSPFFEYIQHFNRETHESMDMKDFYPVILNELLNLSSVNSFLRINRTRFFHTVNKGRSSRRFQLIHFEAISNSTFFHGRFIRAKQCVATDERDYIVAIFDLLTHQSISIHH